MPGIRNLSGWPGYFRIILILFFYSSLGYGQKPTSRMENLEIFDQPRDKDYRTDYGKVDRRSGVIRYIYQENYKITRSTTQEGIRDYLQSQARRFGISSVENDLQFSHEVTSPGGQHFTYIQKIQNIPVYHAGITVTVNNAGVISFVSSTYQPHVTIKTNQYKISSTAAMQHAREYLKFTSSGPMVSGSDLMIFTKESNEVRLVYRVQIMVPDPRGDWEILVDAGSGAVLQARNLLRYQTAADGQGMVWDPDPVTVVDMYYGGSFIDNNDADSEVLNNLRIPVILNDLKYLNGQYYLEGPYVKLEDIDDSPADNFPVLTDPAGFNFTRHQQEFEDVMVYYHIDQAGRYLDYLGFNISGLMAFHADPHGLNGGDNSYYSPLENNCVFGEGGVDDAEDADVIWHEYNHAIMQNIQPWMQYHGETAAIEEGSSDYWAASYSRSRSGFAWGQLFVWDAGITSANDLTGTFWSGRRCDLDWHYPEDYDFTATKGHKNGQIWSSALMHIWSDLGRDVTDRLFIQAIYLWGKNPDFHDAAEAFMHADQLLYDGRHLADIVYWFDYHGLIDPDQSFPSIIHSPLPDSEDLDGPYTVHVKINPALAPLDLSNLWIVWGYDGTFTDSVRLQPDIPPDTYYAIIPGNEQADSIIYYITATDTAGLYAASPGRAPLDFYTFHIGTDSLVPMLMHAALKDQSIKRWPPRIDAFATDNGGIDRVILYYQLEQSQLPDSVQLVPALATGWFSGYFGLDSSQVAVGDTVFYRLLAKDQSRAGNITMLPETGFFAFVLTSHGGEIVFDFEADDGGFTGQGDWEWGIPTSGPRAALSGNRVWATDLNGYYTNGPLLSSLHLPEIDLKDFAVATLQFWHWYDAKPPGDGGNVKISVDGGLNWQIIKPLFGYNDRIDTMAAHDMKGEEVFTGKSAGWIKACFDLSTFLNNTVHIKFDFGSDSAETGSGWYIDSLVVLEKSVKLLPPVNLSVLDNHGSVILGWEHEMKAKEPGGSFWSPLNYMLFPVELQFKIYRSENGSDFLAAGYTTHNSFTDSTVFTGQTYAYYITSLAGATESDPSDTVQTTVQVVIGLEKQDAVPGAYALLQNYPNPFNPLTVIQYHLPQSSNVNLILYDILGREVAVLVKDRQPAGYYTVEFNAGRLSSGIYLYKIETEHYSATKKMIVIR